MLNNWREVSLEEVANDITVGFVGSMATEYIDDGVPFLRSLNVDPYRINFDDIRYISPEFHNRIKKSTLHPGDVVIVRTGKPGTCAIIPDSLPEANCSDLVIVRPGPYLDARFFVYYVNGAAVQHISSHLVGAVQQHFNIGSARVMKINLPPLAEQKRIAHVLGTLDDKIELNRRMNATLEAIAQALFKSWFVDFDPVRAKASGEAEESICGRLGISREVLALFPDRLVESELGEIPEGWRIAPIYEAAKVIYGAPFASSKFNNDQIGKPLIRIRDLSHEMPGIWTDEIHPKGYMVQPGDIVVGMDGEFRAYLWGGDEAWLNQRVCVFAPKQGYSAVFVRNSIMAPLAQVEATETATTVIHLGKNDIDRFSIVLSTDDVLRAFSSVGQSWYKQIVANKQQCRTLATLRETLLPKLLAGELSVAAAGEAVEAVA